ncbi:MAG: hypothetical protein OEU86_02800 [Gammaproteobacteria bacterium]|nr:hypothetical protein [Gammaproteobacteria bacterium]
MMGEHDDFEEMDELAETEDEVEAELPISDTDNVGGASVEINVDDLIAEIEAESGISANQHETCARKRLEKLLEEKRIARELEEIDEFALDYID